MDKIEFNKKTKKNEDISENKIKNLTHKMAFTLDSHLLAKASNIINSFWTINDYRFTSLSHLIREALKALKNKEIEPASQRSISSPKRNITLFFDDELYIFYNSLPNRKRTEIIEKTLISYLNNIN